MLTLGHLLHSGISCEKPLPFLTPRPTPARLRKRRLFGLLLLASGLALPTQATAQTQAAPNPTPATVARTEEYCLVTAIFRYAGKPTISIDYEEPKYFSENSYNDVKGKPQSFSSVVDALNFINSTGWEFANAYSDTAGAGQ